MNEAVQSATDAIQLPIIREENRLLASRKKDEHEEMETSYHARTEMSGCRAKSQSSSCLFHPTAHSTPISRNHRSTAPMSCATGAWSLLRFVRLLF